MSDERPAATPSSFWGRLGSALARLVRFGLRLLLELIMGVALGVAGYSGVLALYYQYVQPVQVHSIRLDILTDRQEEASLQVTQRLDDLQVRLEALEAQGNTDEETIVDLQVRLAAADEVQATHTASLAALEKLQSDLETIQASLETLQAIYDRVQADLETLQADVEPLQAAQGSVRADLETLQATQDTVQAAMETSRAAQDTVQAIAEAVQTRVDALSQTVAENSQDILALDTDLHGKRSPAALFRELQLVRAMGLLTRSRLLLVQHNLGLAESDIRSGRELLVALQSEVPAYQAEALADIVERLDAVLENLPGAPVAAADELDGAWQLLVEGLPGGMIATPAPEVTPEASPTPQATPEATLVATPTPTATPKP